MVKAVVAEETRLKPIEDRLAQSSLPSEVGLIIGKFSSGLDRAFVFDLIPTPNNDSGDPASSISEPEKKKGSKSDTSSLFIDKDWVAEHARQVSRMLVGGMKVVGIYVWISDGAFKNSTIVLCQTVKVVAEAAVIVEAEWDERLLLHICYSPRRWSCRNCSLSSNITSSSLRPCDFKMGKVLNYLQTFKCMYNFTLRLPIFHDNASKFHTFSDVLRHAISLHAKELKGARALIDGKLVVDGEPYSTDGVHEVELLLPFTSNTPFEAFSQRDVVGILSFSGLVCSFAYLNSKEPISQAITDIKNKVFSPNFTNLVSFLVFPIPPGVTPCAQGDIIMSLQSRLDIICDEADADSGSGPDVGREASSDLSTEKPVSQCVLHLLRKGCMLPFPRRVFAPWLAGIYVCDYLQPSDTVEVLKDHCTELLSMKAPTDVSTILELEKEAISVKTKSFWDVAVPFSSAIPQHLEKSKTDDSRELTENNKSANSGHVNLMAAIFILLLSILLGFVFFLQKS
ncbi:hypothetical protein Ahy_A07g036685 isoform B [Arachis hypogaea]|uniref:Protein odr-4 homolog n=1 Tax=Arachis hypogaea TaxID=3818 RepID=A0A445CGS4_ARAHY|nr:hypothetical protein Ahy_A07g036685 isoform B [Arachis hypogaea]